MKSDQAAPTGMRKVVGIIATAVAVILVWETLEESVEVFGSDVPTWLFGIVLYLAGAAVVWGLSTPRRS